MQTGWWTGELPPEDLDEDGTAAVDRRLVPAAELRVAGRLGRDDVLGAAVVGGADELELVGALLPVDELGVDAVVDALLVEFADATDGAELPAEDPLEEQALTPDSTVTAVASPASSIE